MAQGELRQYIVANRGLDMSPGKLAAQVAHASCAFLLHSPDLDVDLLSEWVSQGEAKVVLAVPDEDGLRSLVERAHERGFEENRDFFCIHDACRTELTPDESGSRWTCVGFVPATTATMGPVTGSLPLYR